MSSKGRWWWIGATRLVIKTGCYVVKLPRPAPWRNFLQGLLANMQEREFSRMGWPELCPVTFSISGGLLVVMPFCESISKDAFDALPEDWGEREEYKVPVEMKHSSFGVLDGKTVAVDYGS